MWQRLVWGFLGGLVSWSRVWSAAISGVSWRASVGRWSVMWSVAVRMMHISAWVWALWTTPVVLSIIPVVWPGMASVGVMVTFAVISVRMGLWSRPTTSVPVFMMVVWGWSSVAATTIFWSVVMCRCTWRRYPMWVIHYYVTMLITLETLNTGAVTCYMTWFLAFKTAIFLVRHNIYCWG